MNKAEQKYKISEILSIVAKTKNNLIQKENILLEVLKKAENLKEMLLDLEYEDVFDLEDFTHNLYTEFFERELSEAYEAIEEFNNDIEELMSEVSNTRSEKLNEKYGVLDEVMEKFDQSIMSYEGVEQALEHIDEAIETLSEMKK